MSAQQFDFEKSQEAAFRRNLRRIITQSNLTRCERDITMALVNHWLHHRKKNDGVVHPGREKLAKRSGASLASVKRTLAMLRDAKVVRAVAHLEGRGRCATEYRLYPDRLIAFLSGSNEPPSAIRGVKSHPMRGVRMSPRISTVSVKLEPKPEASNVIPFRKRKPSQKKGSV